MRSGVSLLSRKAWAIRPANPDAHHRGSGAASVTGWPSVRPRGIDGDALAGVDSRADLGLGPRGGADGDPSQAGRPFLDDEEAVQAAALEDRGRRDEEPRGPVRRRNEEAGEEARAQAGCGRQVGPYLEAVRGRVGGGGHGPNGRLDRLGLAVHLGLEGRAGAELRDQVAVDRGASLEAAPSLDLDDRGARRDDVSHVRGARRHHAVEGGAQHRVGEVVPGRGHGGRRPRRAGAASSASLGVAAPFLRSASTRARSTSAALAAASAAARADRRAVSSSRATTCARGDRVSLAQRAARRSRRGCVRRAPRAVGPGPWRGRQ